MSNVNMAKQVFLFLPKTLKTDNGDAFTIEWQDGNEWHHGVTPPYGTFTYLGEEDTSRPFLSDPEPTTVEATETISFIGGAFNYALSEPDVSSITSLTGTVNGSPFTFTEGTDFEVVSLNGYMTDNAIHWIDGGTHPDDTTSFTVVYRHNMYNLQMIVYERHTYRVAIHAKELRSGENGATKAYAKHELVDMLGQSLTNYVNARDGQRLVEGLSFSGARPFGLLPPHQGESRATWVADLTFKMRNVVADQTVKTIGKIDLSNFTTENSS